MSEEESNQTGQFLELTYDPVWQLAIDDDGDGNDKNNENISSNPHETQTTTNLGGLDNDDDDMVLEFVTVIFNSNNNNNNNNNVDIDKDKKSKEEEEKEKDKKEKEKDTLKLDIETRLALCKISPMFNAMFSRWKNNSFEEPNVILPQVSKKVFECIIQFAKGEPQWRNSLKEHWMEILMAAREFLIPSLILECGRIPYRLTLYTMLIYERIFAQFRGQYTTDHEFDQVINTYHHSITTTTTTTNTSEANSNSSFNTQFNISSSSSHNTNIKKEEEKKEEEKAEENKNPANNLRQLYELHIEAIAVKLRTEFHTLQVLAEYTWIDEDQIKRLITWFYKLGSFETQLLFRLVIHYVTTRLVKTNMNREDIAKLYKQFDECFEEGYLETDLLREMQAKGMLLQRGDH